MAVSGKPVWVVMWFSAKFLKLFHLSVQPQWLWVLLLNASNNLLFKLTQSCIGPSFRAARCVDQEHARLVGHPRTEEQQESSQHYPTL